MRRRAGLAEENAAEGDDRLLYDLLGYFGIDRGLWRFADAEGLCANWRLVLCEALQLR